MTSLARMLAILDLFDEGASAWTAERIAGHLGYSVPTSYRYVRELGEAGLLRRDAGGTYVLGPRVIELDHHIRVGDPLLNAGRGIMRALADSTGYDVVLGTIYGERIITIAQEHGTEVVGATYGRGRRMPLFRGMLSKTILATLPRARLRRLYENHLDEALATDFARSFENLVDELKGIRSAGYCVTHGELDQELVGIAVPMASNAHRIIASVGMVVTRRSYGTANAEQLASMLETATRDIVRELPSDKAGVETAPRANRAQSRVRS